MTSLFDNIPPTINRYVVPRSIVASTIDALRRTGRGRKEAVVLWQGKVISEHHAEVTKLLIPRQVAGPLHFNIPLEERLRIVDEVNEVGEFILIQLHTHPKEAFHSEVDDRLAITKHLHAISIVIPDFGMFWTGDLHETSMHINLGGGCWRELTMQEISELFEVA